MTFFSSFCFVQVFFNKETVLTMEKQRLSTNQCHLHLRFPVDNISMSCIVSSSHLLLLNTNAAREDGGSTGGPYLMF